MPARKSTAESYRIRLTQLFQRNAHIRVPREERRREIGLRYKKGWEVRLVLKSQEELEEARDLLEQASLKPGRPFRKSRQWALPVYGKPAVDLFLSWKGDTSAGEPGSP